MFEQVNFENPHTKMALEFFAKQLRAMGIEVEINNSEEFFEFKTGEDNTEVVKMPLIFKFSLASVDRVLDGLEATTTNDRIVMEVSEQVSLLKELGEVLQNIDIDNLKAPQRARNMNEDVDIFSLFQALVAYNPTIADRISQLGLFDHENLFNTKSKLRAILGGELQINITIDIVYKRIDNAEGPIQREIDFYSAFQDAGINTFCAFKFKYVDGEKGAYDFTRFEGELITVANAQNFFRMTQNGITLFKLVLDEMLKAHSQGLLHGDLHFKNIGYVLGMDGRFIILFDLVRASRFDINSSTSTQKLLGELLNFGQNLLKKVMDQVKGSDAKKQVRADLDNYLSDLDKAISGIDIDTVRSYCFSELYDYLNS